MKTLVIAIALLGACKFDPLPSLSGDGGGGDDGGGGPDGCVGLECQVEDCNGAPPTSLSGTVMLPNGTTPMANVDVYVPNTTPIPFNVGASCLTCGELSGDPIVKTRTDAAGRFALMGVPSGNNVPLVVTIGKWRRQLTIPNVTACTTLMIDPQETRLPRGRTDTGGWTTSVDLPKIAVSTGQADALECILRKAGIADTEFGTGDFNGIPGGPEAIHMFAPGGSSSGTRMFASGSFAGSAMNLWNSRTTLLKYDVVMLACEGATNPSTKPQASRDAMKDYVDNGGRVFASHYANIWIGGDPLTGIPAPPTWDPIADFNASTGTLNAPELYVDNGQPTFSSWLTNVGAAAANGRLPITANSGRTSIDRLDPNLTTRWMYAMPGALQVPQHFTFNAPVDRAPMEQCGRVAFSDVHTGGPVPSPNSTFPQECPTGAPNPQELALIYLLFDLQRCAGGMP